MIEPLDRVKSMAPRELIKSIAPLAPLGLIKSLVQLAPREPLNLVDLHTHILPGLDDGAASLPEAQRMLEIAASDGITRLIATPHFMAGWFEPQPAQILAAVEQLNQYAKAKGLQIRVLPGMEVALSPEVPALLQQGRLLTLNQQGHYSRKPNSDSDSSASSELTSTPFTPSIPNQQSQYPLKPDPSASSELTSTPLTPSIPNLQQQQRQYLLLELPAGDIPFYTESLLFELQLKGITPVLAHPERNRLVAENPQRLKEMVARGALVQITGDSILGKFGRQTRQTAQELAKAGLVHSLGSDAHSSRHRPPVLKSAAAALTKLLGPAKTGLITRAEAIGIPPISLIE